MTRSEIPDALGIRGRAQIAYEELHSLQHRLAMLEAQIRDGGHQDDAPAGDSGKTFGEHRADLEAKLEKWADTHAHLIGAVESIIARSERQQEAQERAQEQTPTAG